MTSPSPGALALTARLATSATGYAAVIDGILNIRSVTETRNMAAYNALWLNGFQVQTSCTDVECDCMVRLLERLRPGTKLIAVTVEASA